MFERRDVPMTLSPLAGPLAVERSGRKTSFGLYHYLSGAAYQVPEGLHDLLILSQAEGLDRRAWLELCGDTALAALIDRLRHEQIVVETQDRAELLLPFLDLAFVKPLRNPALVRRPEGQCATVILPQQMSRCELPRTAEPPGIVEEEMPDLAAEIFSCARGDMTLRDAFAKAGIAPVERNIDRVWSTIVFLCQPDRQLIRSVAPGRRPRDAGSVHHFLIRTLAWHETPYNETPDLAAAFYARGIETAEWNFDWVEPTVSHAFRKPSAVLGGEAYGARFCEAAVNQGHRLASLPERISILEIGAGLGDFAASFIERLRRMNGRINVQYTILDHSPRLIEAQRQRLSEVRVAADFIEGDAAAEIELGRRFDIIVANEMIADLRPAIPSPHGLDGPGDIELTIERGQRPDGLAVLLRNIRSHLAPQGAAFLTEFGDRNIGIERVAHLNHPEHSIAFEAAANMARALGFEASIQPLTDFLNVCDEIELLCGQQEHHLCLNSLLARHGLTAPYLAFTRDEFLQRYADVITKDHVLGIQFAVFSSGLYFGPDMRQFWILKLRTS